MVGRSMSELSFDQSSPDMDDSKLVVNDTYTTINSYGDVIRSPRASVVPSADLLALPIAESRIRVSSRTMDLIYLARSFSRFNATGSHIWSIHNGSNIISRVIQSI